MSRGAPVELTTFIGRRRELAEGRRMLRAAPLVTLVGPGGVGKTRLAQRLAHQVGRTFPDGVVWVELAAQHDAASVAGQVVSALGVDAHGQSVEAALTTYLQSRRLLIVLDNCEHLVAACAQLAAALLGATPDIRILTTSRQALGLPAEHLMNIEPLPVPTSSEAASGKVGHIDAVALLTDRARANDPRFRIDADNAADAGRLCRRLDGIPLAIELAAARLRVLSLEQIVGRLDDRFDLLTTGSRTALPRHQTLQGLIDWSYELCSPAEQAIWARMSVFEGGAEIEAVEAVCAEPGSSTRDLLDGLVDKSIVTVTHSEGRDRVRMLETVREYGAEKLAERGETALTRDRHRDHFLALARHSRASWIGPHQQEWMYRVTADQGNLRGAFEHSLADPRDRTNALELASSLVWFWQQAGAANEGSRWFAKALADPAEPSPFLLQGLVAAIVIESERGDEDTALPLARRAAALPHSRHDAADDAAHHVAVATEALLTGDDAAAVTAYAVARARYEVAGDSLGQLECLATGANLAKHLGHAEQALSMVEQAARLCDAQGDRCWRAYLHFSRGDLLMDLGRSVDALAAARSSLESWSVLEPVSMGGALHIVAWAYLHNGEEHLGAVLFGVRQRIRKDLGVQPGPLGLHIPYEVTEAEIIQAIGEDAFRAAHDEGFAMPLEDAVELALGRHPTAPTRASRTTPPETLSKRETQVAELVAAGLSNKEIAEELVISTRTAEGHVAKVMDKLGVNSREQIAARFAGGAASQE